MTMHRRHKFISYQGYSFPWYVVVMWIVFVFCAVVYLLRYVLGA